MVKIKEGYVMTAREKIEFDRVNALPRKASGKVEYYYKPETKYPPRIYVFMHAEIWQDRNRRPMGLYNAVPFLIRAMNREEIEYHHFNIRLCYHQYEDWEKLIYAKQQEAEELDKENPGKGTEFLAQLKSCRERYSIGKSKNPLPVAKPEQTESEETRYIRELIQHGQYFTAKEVAELMRKEQEGEKRLPVLILLRELYKNFGRSEAPELTAELIDQKVIRSQERSRKNFVRRIYRKNKLFALEEIRSRYPDYTEVMLLADLQQKTCKLKRPKLKPVQDLRRCQLEKLAFKLKMTNDEKEYHATCCRIVMFQNAHELRLPIPITVNLTGQSLVYYFPWKIREQVVKSFVALANTKGITHLALGKRHQEMVSSSYSY